MINDFSCNGALISREDAKTRRLDVEEISAMVVDCGYRLHVEAGPGLLESVYEVALARLLLDKGLKVTRQAPMTCSHFIPCSRRQKLYSQFIFMVHRGNSAW
jgi:hypothetical protein